jgi:site-specific recombinase XerD
VKLLEKWIDDYLMFMAENGWANRTVATHEWILRHFKTFAAERGLPGDKAVLPENRADFLDLCKLTKAHGVIVGFSRWLEETGIVEKPEDTNAAPLPDVFERYVERIRKTRSVKDSRIIQIRKELGGFHVWLKDCGIRLSDLKIGQVDDFLRFRARGLAPGTCSDIRSIVKGFLRYLWLEQKILRRDLASMIVSAPVFAYENPPKYLRKDEIRKLFAAADLGTNEGLRAHAMMRLAYTTGLRPGEIARILMSDVSFEKGELTVPERKGNNPVRFPLPEETVKSVAAYVIGARPENAGRNLFVSLSPPHNPVTGGLVSDAIAKVMRRAGVPGTPYWLRHTYAQNLLESGASIFEIKEMLGHDCIKATKRYLHIHIKLMREVLFDD